MTEDFSGWLDDNFSGQSDAAETDDFFVVASVGLIAELED